MKQLFKELHMENKPYYLLAARVVIVFVLLFSGLVLRGFPYACIACFWIIPFEATSIKLETQIEYLIPRSITEKRKITIEKSIVEAGLFAVTTFVGYVLTISFSNKYQWDGSLIFLVFYILVYVFIMVLNFRLDLYYGTVHENVDKNEQLYVRALIKEYGVEGFIQFISVFYLFCYVVRKMGDIEELIVINNYSYTWLIDTIIFSLIIIIYIRKTINNIKNLTFTEYHDNGRTD